MVQSVAVRRAFSSVFSDGSSNLRAKVARIYLLLIAANVAAWVSALVTFRQYPVLLGTALLAYSLGLRHAVDADHLAAIDNVTRKLMQDGKRPVAVGLFFSLGHSTVVVLASVATAAAAAASKDRFEAFQSVGGVIGTMVSAPFLLAIAAMNVVILGAVYRTFRRMKAGAPYLDEDLTTLLAGRGLLARLCRPMFRLIRRSWHMYPLGFLFGLGFDTATEVGLLGISGAQAAQGMSIWSILVFPALFTAGMALADTTDSILMLCAYGWAYVRPICKLYYNLTITSVSVVVAVVIGGIEVLGMVGDLLGLGSPFWQTIAGLNKHFAMIGYLIIAIFVVTWIAAAAIYHMRGYSRVQSATTTRIRNR
jgi:high-affinity nickel-transport protein